MADSNHSEPVSPAAQEGVDNALNQHTQGAREYLEATTVPVLLQGLTALTRERPENPVDYLALYLLKRNPNKSVTVEVPVKQA